MRVIYLSNFYPRCKRDYYFSRSRSGLASAADAHQYAIAQGLKIITDNLIIINLPAVPPFPHRNKDMMVKSETIRENGLIIHNEGSCNLAFYQFISRYYHAKNKLSKEVSGCNEVTYIVVYATNLAFLRAATEIKEEYKYVRICLIVPDLPEDMASFKFSRIRNFFSSLFFKPYYSYINQFDSFVLLTRSMAEIIGCKEGSYIVNEGVYDEADSPRIISSIDNEKFTVFYSGMMYRKFGVMNLVSAVHQMKSPNVRLLMCGYGEVTNEICRLSEIDNRIQYLGAISRLDALNYQSQADLLVNPRIPDRNPFTKYSFPSKNIEYLASGTPTLLYQLEGIPDEYYHYCYYLDKYHVDVESLKNKIEEIMRLSAEERRQKALAARDFILKNKNAEKAGRAIYDLLESTI
jgi:glycosyltransferase involved in cell wall biosynthesis